MCHMTLVMLNRRQMKSSAAVEHLHKENRTSNLSIDRVIKTSRRNDLGTVNNEVTGN